MRLTRQPYVVSRSRSAPVCMIALLGVMVTILATLSGCTRRFYRTDADAEVASILDEKDNFAEWELRDYNVYPNPLARYYDPANPDRPPMPPDDPAAWLLSPHPQKPRQIAMFEGVGYLALMEQWDAQNRERLKAKKRPPEVTPITLGKPAVEPLPDAVSGEQDVVIQLSLRAPEPGSEGIRTAEFAREYAPGARVPESRRELASLVAPGAKQDDKPKEPELLPLPREAAGAPAYQSPRGYRREPYVIDLDQAVELAVINSREYQNRREDLYLAALPVTLQRFAFTPQFEVTMDAIRTKSGSEAVGGKRNDWRGASDVQLRKLFSTGALLVVQLANTTVVNLTGNGKHTISESDLILDLSQPFLRGGGRAVTLENLTQAERSLVYELRSYARFHREFFVSIAAGGGGLASGGGVGDFGGVQLTVRGQAAAVGYFPTLVQQASLRNEERNQAKLSTLRVQYKNLATDPLPAGGRGITPLQVDQVEQQQRQSESTILGLRTRYQDSLDQFKIQLGLSTDFPLEIDNSLLDGIYKQIDAYEGMINTSRAVARELAKLSAETVSGAQVREVLRRIIGGTGYFRGARDRWEQIRPTLTPQRLKELRDEIDRLQKEYDELDQKDRPVPPELEDRLNSLKLDVDLAALDEAVRSYELEPWRREVNPEAIRKVRNDAFDRVILTATNAITQVKRGYLDIVGREENWPKLPPLMLNGEDLLLLMAAKGEESALAAQGLVGQTALANRLDLMNQRGRLVDGWRDIAVFANSLLGTFDVRYHMDVATPAGLAKPLDFEGKRSRQQLFLNTELPLVRVMERNNYRASLIAYQRQRRTLMATEDAILFQIRQNLRQLNQLAEQYRIRQREVDLAHRQVDNALEALEQATGDPAAQTNQLLNAIRSVPNAENNLISAYVSYATTRMEFYRDLELMRVDSRGVWIDEYATPPVQGPAVQPPP